jgi:hypothetical protein
VIIAVDPGLATFGYAVVDERGVVHDLGVVTSESNAKKLGKHRDRRERLRVQARALDAVLRQWRERGTLALVAEEMSFKRGKLTQIVSMALSWGDLVGLAVAHGATDRAVPPKTWQRALFEPDELAAMGTSIDYTRVEAKLSQYATEQCRDKLAAIARSKRNHALDAIGVGVYAAMTPEDVPREKQPSARRKKGTS